MVDDALQYAAKLVLLCRGATEPAPDLFPILSELTISIEEGPESSCDALKVFFPQKLQWASIHASPRALSALTRDVLIPSKLALNRVSFEPEPSREPWVPVGLDEIWGSDDGGEADPSRRVLESWLSTQSTSLRRVDISILITPSITKTLAPTIALLPHLETVFIRMLCGYVSDVENLPASSFSALESLLVLGGSFSFARRLLTRVSSKRLRDIWVIADSDGDGRPNEFLVDFPQLQSVRLHGKTCPWRELSRICSAGHGITCLDVINESFSPELSDDRLARLASALPRLTKFQYKWGLRPFPRSGERYPSIQGIQALNKYCHELKIIHLTADFSSRAPQHPDDLQLSNSVEEVNLGWSALDAHETVIEVICGLWPLLKTGKTEWGDEQSSDDEPEEWRQVWEGVALHLESFDLAT